MSRGRRVKSDEYPLVDARIAPKSNRILCGREGTRWVQFLPRHFTERGLLCPTKLPRRASATEAVAGHRETLAPACRCKNPRRLVNFIQTPLLCGTHCRWARISKTTADQAIESIED